MAYGILDDSGTTLIASFAAPISVINNRPEFGSDALSLARAVVRRAAQRWEIETQIVPLSSSAQELFAMLVMKGHSETLKVKTPQNFGLSYLNQSSSSPTASGSAGASSVSVSGNSGLISVGTFVRFASHSKVYMTTTSLNGSGSLGIYPPLRSTASGQMYHRDDVIMTCYFDYDTVSGMKYKDGILMDPGVIKLVEKV